MASNQNESIEEIMKQLEYEGALSAIGHLKNRTEEPLIVMNHCKFAGTYVKEFPSPLHITGLFGMAAVFDKCFEAAVVYSGKNKDGVECGWLLGFVGTKDAGKVYVDCGTKEKFRDIDWPAIKIKIEQGGGTAYHLDKDTGTIVDASIYPIPFTKGHYVVTATIYG